MLAWPSKLEGQIGWTFCPAMHTDRLTTAATSGVGVAHSTYIIRKVYHSCWYPMRHPQESKRRTSGQTHRVTADPTSDIRETHGCWGTTAIAHRHASTVPSSS